MLPITTKYLGPTNRRGSRIKATNGNRSRTISKPLNADDDRTAHWAAALALLEATQTPWRRFDWAGYAMEGGGFVFVPVLASKKVFEKEG